ncbi:MAG: hypothetical protein IKJ29_04930 [Akkermansia sp.]|nr:hypothetical protein [Akkermansia sp.]
MDKPHHSTAPESEEQLVALLATLKVEQVPEADFESRFLAEFHERVARDTVCCTARRRLLSHVLQLVDNFGRGRLAFGASALGLGILAICFSLFPAGHGGVETAASVSHERKITPLQQMPALSDDLAECTTIQVVPAQSVFGHGGVTITRGQHSTVIEVSNMSLPVRVVEPAAGASRSASPELLPSSAVRYSF